MKSLPTLLIAWRFLASQTRAVLMGVLGIALGVAFFIITQAQTKGFEEFFIKTILGTNGAIRIAERYQNTREWVPVKTSEGEEKSSFQPTERPYEDGIDYPDLLKNEIVKIRGVSAVSEILEGSADGMFGGRTLKVSVNGIRLYDQLRVSSLGRQIVSGDLSSFSSISFPVVIGSRLAKRLGIKCGDKMTLRTMNESAQAEVVAIFQTGSGDVDLQRIYMPISQARALLKKSSGGSVLQLSLDEPAQAPAIAATIARSYGYQAISWQEREKVWLSVFSALRISSALTVLSIVIIAAMGIFNTLTMMVMEKTRQVAILMAMGYAAADIRMIFGWQGVFLGGVGGFLGLVLGALGTALVERLPVHIRGIFSADHFVVSWDISHYLVALFLALLAVFVATLWPAMRAGKIEPAAVLRGGAL
jgi:lipoprotein-releasing system permease protein